MADNMGREGDVKGDGMRGEGISERRGRGYGRGGAVGGRGLGIVGGERI